MGIMDYLSNLDLSNLDLSNVNPEDFQNGGLLGGAFMTKMRNEAAAREAREKPGKYCFKTCMVDDERCKECLEVQEKFAHSLYQLEKLEDLSEMTEDQVREIVSAKKIEKCGFCGAPFESGYSECPFCGTEYPSDGIDFDIPASSVDRDKLMNQKIQETWDLMVEKIMFQQKIIKESAGDDFMGKFQKFFSSATLSMSSMYQQNVSELKECAKNYGVGISRYISGVALDEYETPKSLYYKEQSRILTEQSRQQNAAIAQQAAARAERNKFTAMDYMQRYAEHASYGYSGGYSSSNVCGTCNYYIAADRKCLYFAGTSGEYRSGANDSCNNHRS